MLKVKLLAEGAKAPTVAHPREDLGYDLYALEVCNLWPGSVVKIRTGIAVEDDQGWGFIIKDRSSMAAKGFSTHGGVIDAGYRGEVVVLMSYNPQQQGLGLINPGDKIAQMVPVPVLTQEVEVVDELTSASRGEKGFGSSGR